MILLGNQAGGGDVYTIAVDSFTIPNDNAGDERGGAVAKDSFHSRHTLSTGYDEEHHKTSYRIACGSYAERIRKEGNCL